MTRSRLQHSASLTQTKRHVVVRVSRVRAALATPPHAPSCTDWVCHVRKVHRPEAAVLSHGACRPSDMCPSFRTNTSKMHNVFFATFSHLSSRVNILSTSVGAYSQLAYVLHFSPVAFPLVIPSAAALPRCIISITLSDTCNT